MNSPSQPGNRAEAPAAKPESESDSKTSDPSKETQPQVRREVGGPPGLEPTRYGDWEKAGRCIDF
jgi:hypothetical protein